MSLLFECASSTTNLHYPIKAKDLACGHSLCCGCYAHVIKNKAYKDIKEFGCKHCGRIYDENGAEKPIIGNNNNFNRKNNYKVNNRTFTKQNKDQKVYNYSINDAFKVIVNEFKENLMKIKSSEVSINKRIECIFDEVDIRVESIKYELDNIRDEIRTEILNKKDDILRDLTDKQKDSEKCLSELQENLDKKKTMDGTLLSSYETKILEIKKTLSHVESEISFEINDMSIDKTIIGFHTYENNLKKRLDMKSYQKFEITNDSKKLHVLPNNTLLVVKEDNKFEIYDNSFKIIKEQTGIDSAEIDCVAVTTNKKDKIYLLDDDENEILMTDLECNLIKKHQHKRLMPSDIDFYNGHLYVCNPMFENVVKLTEDLKFVRYFKLDLTPMFIKILNNVACISTVSKTIYFYDLNSDYIKLLYKFELDNPICSMNIFNNGLYLTCLELDKRIPQKLYLFKNKFDSYSKIDLEKDQSVRSVATFNGNLLATLNTLIFNDVDNFQLHCAHDNNDDTYDSDDDKYGPFGYYNSIDAYINYHTNNPYDSD